MGKIHDLFARRGITKIIKAAGNDAAMRAAERVLRDGAPFSFLFVNLIEFDTEWGHRRDAAGYARGLERFDAWLGRFLARSRAGHPVRGHERPRVRSDDAGFGSYARIRADARPASRGAGRGNPLGTRATPSAISPRRSRSSSGSSVDAGRVSSTRSNDNGTTGEGSASVDELELNRLIDHTLLKPEASEARHHAPLRAKRSNTISSPRASIRTTFPSSRARSRGRPSRSARSRAFRSAPSTPRSRPSRPAAPSRRGRTRSTW